MNRRAQKKYRGKKLSPVTLRKEITTLRAAWNWAVLMNLVKGQYPSKGLVYPKTDEKPSFMTRAEIEWRITPGTKPEIADELWHALYLQKNEIDEFLDFVRINASHGWIHPMLCTAVTCGGEEGPSCYES